MQCKNFQKNCCTDTPRVPITIEDVKMITSMGFSIYDFLIAGEYAEDFTKDTEDWWKNSMVQIDNKMFKINMKKREMGIAYSWKTEKVVH